MCDMEVGKVVGNVLVWEWVIAFFADTAGKIFGLGLQERRSSESTEVVFADGITNLNAGAMVVRIPLIETMPANLWRVKNRFLPLVNVNDSCSHPRSICTTAIA